MQQDVSQHEQAKANASPQTIWTQRLVISLTLLAWIVLAGIVFWLMGRIAQALFLLAIGALLAYTMYPMVQLLRHIMPNPFAIAIVYLAVLAALSVLVYFVAIIFIDQVLSLIQYIQDLINGSKTDQMQSIFDTLTRFGISQSRLRDFGQQILGQLQGFVRNVIPVITNVFSVFLNTIIAAMLSVYFLLSGPRTITWLRTRTPSSQREHIVFVLDTLGSVVGGYIRGIVLLATIFSTLTGISIALIGVPYPFLLAVLTFILEFIPIIGVYITGAAILLLAFTQGWVTGLLALGVIILLQLLENNVLAPRILGRSVGISPIVNLFALIAGTNLFGIAGAFFAAPVAGTIQAFIHALWTNWHRRHPEQFQTEDEETKPQGTEAATDKV